MSVVFWVSNRKEFTEMSLKSRDFFLKGTHKQFEFVLGKYQEALRAKAEAMNSKPENLLKLDKWFHNDLPKKIKSRGKDAHLTHDEIVQGTRKMLKISQKIFLFDKYFSSLLTFSRHFLNYFFSA